MRSFKINSGPTAGQIMWLIGVASIVVVLAGLMFLPR